MANSQNISKSPFALFSLLIYHEILLFPYSKKSSRTEYNHKLFKNFLQTNS